MKIIFFLILCYFFDIKTLNIYFENKTGAKKEYLKILIENDVSIDFENEITMPDVCENFLIQIIVNNKKIAESEVIKVKKNTLYCIEYKNNKFKIKTSKKPIEFHKLLDCTKEDSDD